MASLCALRGCPDHRAQDQVAELPTYVHSASTIITEPAPAHQVDLDPRKVIMPIIATRVEQLLHTYGIYNKWKHILVGLINGFDVGIKCAPERTIIFRKSQILQT